MPTLTLHLGLHKTGTTAFQVALFGQRELLAQNGIVYPKRKANHSEDLYTMFSSKPEVYLPNVVEQRVGDALEQYRNDCFDAWRQILTDAPDDAHILVSGEDLSLLDQEGWMALLDFFGPYVSDVQAVAVVLERLDKLRQRI